MRKNGEKRARLRVGTGMARTLHSGGYLTRNGGRSMQIKDFLKTMVERGGSDAHLKVGKAPGMRIAGKITPSEGESLTPADTEAIAREVLNEEQWRSFDFCGDIDCSYSIPGVARFRVNVMRQRGTISLVLRHIPERIPTFDELGLPQVCRSLATKPRGLVLVTGPTGSGKSTTLAAMVDLVNSNEYGHILTMEDPVEFLHTDKKCYINQREVGTDTQDFNQALRRALRQDPDVILVGEMRDLETISLAVTAAETGHLVLGTLHTTSAMKSIDRMVSVFPPEQQMLVRMQLAGTLQGIISQTLLPKVGGWRVAALEILIANDAIRALIRENKMTQIISSMQSGKRVGMQLLEDHMNELIAAGKVKAEDAVAKANMPEMIKTAGARQTAHA
jgi:twitching motility protein PilT